MGNGAAVPRAVGSAAGSVLRGSWRLESAGRRIGSEVAARGRRGKIQRDVQFWFTRLVPEIFAAGGAFLGLPKNAHFNDTTYIPDDYFGL
jgi:hypothetical protein